MLIVGIAAAAPLDNSGPLDNSSPIGRLLRPMDADGGLAGHFHAAVFPHRPLKKRTLPLRSSVLELFESGSIEDVLHLLRDDRPITGQRRVATLRRGVLDWSNRRDPGLEESA